MTTAAGQFGLFFGLVAMAIPFALFWIKRADQFASESRRTLREQLEDERAASAKTIAALEAERDFWRTRALEHGG